MQIQTNCESEPFSLINTKREIFNSDHDRKFQEYIQPINSNEGMDEMIDDGVVDSKYYIIKSSHSNNNKFVRQLYNPTSRPPTINIQNVVTQKRETFIFDNIPYDQKEPGFEPVWKKGSLKIIKLVARFLYQLKTKADKLKIKLMNVHIFNYIDDKGSDYKQFNQNKQINHSRLRNEIWKQITKMSAVFQIFQQLVGYLMNKVGVIYPESSFKIIWDSIVVLIIVINIFFIPMSLSFDLDKSSTSVWLFFETIPSYIFIAEILLNFNTAYYSHGIIHTQRKEIFYNYISNNFWSDLLISVPFVLSQLAIPYIQFVLLLRVTRVKSMVQNVEDVLHARESTQAVLELSKLVYFIIFTAHMCSCAWHLLGKIEMEVYGDTNCWLVHFGYYDQPWQTRYIVSLYWSVITTLTVGYGDIVPRTSIEQLFVVIVALIICGVFGYTISTIGEILKNLEEKKSQFKQLMKEVNSFIKEKELNLQLSLKVRKYYEFFYQTQQSQKRSYQSILNNLNEQLKQEIMVDVYKKVLTSSKFLNETFNDSIINKLCQKVSQEAFGPGDDIINLSNQCERKLMFLLDGQVNSYFQSKALSLSELQHKEKSTFGKLSRCYKKGDILGELEFITNSDYQVSFRASVFTQIAYITRQDLLEIIAGDKELLYKFQKLIDDLTFSKTQGRTCEICKWTHLYQDCPFTFYQPNIWKIVRKASAQINIKRQPYSRKGREKFDAVANSQVHIATIIDFMLHNNIIQEELLGSKVLKKFGFQYKVKEIVELKSESSHSNGSSSDMESDNKQQVESIYQKRGSQQSSIEKIEKLKTCYMRESNHNFFKPKLMTMNSIAQSVVHDDPSITPNIKKPQKFFKKNSSQQNLKGGQNVTTQGEGNQTSLEFKELILKEPLNYDELDKMMQEENYFYPEYNVIKVIEEINKQRIRTLSTQKKRRFHEKLQSIRLQKSFNLKRISPRQSQQVI